MFSYTICLTKVFIANEIKYQHNQSIHFVKKKKYRFTNYTIENYKLILPETNMDKYLYSYYNKYCKY